VYSLLISSCMFDQLAYVWLLVSVAASCVCKRACVLLVFSKKGGMPALLSHYRHNKTVFAFTGGPCSDNRLSWQLHHRSLDAPARLQQD
jgi:hypothetical protein